MFVYPILSTNNFGWIEPAGVLAPYAYQDHAFSKQLRASGFGLTFTLLSGTLPAGLTALEIETGGATRVVGLIQRSNNMPSPLAKSFVTQLNGQLRDILSHTLGLHPRI